MAHNLLSSDFCSICQRLAFEENAAKSKLLQVFHKRQDLVNGAKGWSNMHHCHFHPWPMQADVDVCKLKSILPSGNRAL